MTIDQAISKINNLDNFLQNTPNKLILTPTRGVESLVKERIFLKGINSDSEPIGFGYSKRWAAARTAKKLQIDYVDLKFTGSLRKSLTTKVEDVDTVVMMIDDDFNYKEKALEQEQLRQMDIFALTDKEVEALTDFVEQNFNLQIDKFFA